MQGKEKKRWILPKSARPAPSRFCAELGVSGLVARLLQQRGFREVDAARAFLRPNLKDLHDPDSLPDIEAATERLCHAIRSKQGILLFGDYDVDGITGAAVLGRTLRALGAKVEVYIPDRFKDGYGLRPEPLGRLFSDGLKVDVVITIDNGCVAFDGSEYLASKAVDLIVADHHRMEDDGRLPIARAILHPRRAESRYPNKDLCGAGVAFKLAWATARRFHGGGKLPKPLRDLLLESLALVSLGTVADVMPLTGENRIFVHYGLEALSTGPTPGLKSLLDISGVSKDLTAGIISFRLAPRINAAGRLGAGRRAYDLLCAESAEEAKDLAAVLDSENEARREIEKELTEQAIDQVISIYGAEPSDAALVVSSPGWHEGVVGIVAARLVERFRRPSIVLAELENGRAKGSGRSSLRVDLKAALDDCASLLHGYGGHEAAVGLNLDSKNIPEFREAFAYAVAARLGVKEGKDYVLGPAELRLDAEVSPQEINETTLHELNFLEPHGVGNRKPTFAATVELAGAPMLMGKDGKHLSFHVRADGQRFRCVFGARRMSSPSSSAWPYGRARRIAAFE